MLCMAVKPRLSTCKRGYSARLACTVLMSDGGPVCRFQTKFEGIVLAKAHF